MNDTQLEKIGMEYIEAHFEQYLEHLLYFVTIEAPTGKEHERAEAMCRAFSGYGLSDVHIDSYGNAIGIRKGAVSDRYILIEAHMDTVFPFGTVKETPELIDGKIFCPGIGDNTAGIAEILMVLEALQETGIETQYSLLFVGTVCEEGLGSLRGMKGILSDYRDKIAYAITVDGFNYQDIVYKATGIVTEKIILSGKGGHSGEKGIAPQPLLYGASMIEQIRSIPLSEESGATLAVTAFHGGNNENIHTIPDKAEFIVNYRCGNGAVLADIKQKLHKIIEDTAETAGLSYHLEILCDIPAGSQSRDTDIVTILAGIIEDLGGRLRYAKGGCTNANAAICAGIPSVAIGSSNIDYGEHTLEEYMIVEEAKYCIWEIYLLILRLAGRKEAQDERTDL